MYGFFQLGIFDDGDHLEGSFGKQTIASHGLDTLDEGGEHNGNLNGSDAGYFDYEIQVDELQDSSTLFCVFHWHFQLSFYLCKIRF